MMVMRRPWTTGGGRCAPCKAVYLIRPTQGGGDRTSKGGIEVRRGGDGRVKLSGGAKGELSCTVMSIML